MRPSQIRDALISQLRKTFLAMSSPDFLLDLDDAPAAQQQKAANLLLQIQHARLNLDNADLRDIVQALTDNEQDINDGINNASQALSDLENTKVVLSAVGSFISVVAKIIPLVLVA